MTKGQTIEVLLQGGSTAWNKLRQAGKVPHDHTGATFAQLFSANADLSGLGLIGSEWEKCDLSRVSFREADLSNAYFHGGRLQDCDFRGSNLEGATFEKMKLVRCDFSGARGLEEVEFDEVDMDRVTGLHGEEPTPGPPPPAHGVTSFTREQRTAAAAGALGGPDELPPFRPQDSAGTLVFRGLKSLAAIPAWVLDVPGLRLPTPDRGPGGTSLESLYREAVHTRLENRRPAADPEVVKRAQSALRLGAKEAPFAAMYLREVGLEANFRFSAAKVLRDALHAEMDIDDLTSPFDPRTSGALLELKLTHQASEFFGEARRRLSAAQLFTALLEAGFTPENNWEEALESTEAAQELAALATAGDRAALEEGFRAFTALPEEARLRRLAYLAEAMGHLQALSRLPEGTEPVWLHGPEARECHDREMRFVQVMRAEDIPKKVPELALAELGVPIGTVPEEAEGDLFIHLRCSVCGKEKLLIQSPEPVE
jgi:hypothetical protein